MDRDLEEYSSLYSFLTLLRKEVRRFLIMAPQTLVAPLITVSLYLIVFGVSLGGSVRLDESFSYLDFIIPGLILMGAINNSFGNISSSLFLAKYLGNIADILVTPITPFQFQMAYTIAAMIRGLIVGFLIFLVTLVFSQTPWESPGQALGVLVLGTFIFAQLGIIVSLNSSSFDALSGYTNFVISPLIYLGGLFYPVSKLPFPWNQISRLNPMYYLIEGFRGGKLGLARLPVEQAFIGAAVVALLLGLLSYSLINSGYKLRT